MTTTFSAFRFSAAEVKLKLPVIVIDLSITITLLWKIACLSSAKTLRPALARPAAVE